MQARYVGGLIHVLRGDDCPACRIGIGQARVFVEGGERSVLEDGGVVLV